MNKFWLNQFFKNPRRVASVAPATPVLAQAMISAVDGHLTHQVPIVELGPGLGAITKFLLHHKSKPRVLAIDFDKNMIEGLKNKHTSFAQNGQLTATHGDARSLEKIMGALSWPKVSVMVSSLGLRAMKKDDVEKIAHAIDQSLLAGGVLVQYTYGLSSPIPLTVCKKLNWRATPVCWIFRNLPPARRRTHLCASAPSRG